MSEDLKDLRAVLELGREFGLKRLKTDNLEVEFGPAPGPDGPRKVPIGEEAGAPTEDELLYGSAPGGAPDFKGGVAVFTERLPFGGVAPVGAVAEEPQ